MQGPGDKDLEKMGMPNPMQSDSTARSADSLLVNNKSGGLGGAAQKTLDDRARTNQEPEPPPETYEFPTEEPDSTEDTAKADTAVLSDPKWVQPDTLFHQEAEVSAQLTLPDGKEHITKVQAELFARTPSGPKSISKGEAWAQADGKAVITLPVFKPEGYVDGAVEYFFRIYHSLAKMLSGEKQSRQVSEMALKSADHVLVPGIAFEAESSFIPPKGAHALKPVEAKFNEWDKKYSKKSQIAVFGHTDKGEKDAKGLSERRAQSAFAFITNDVEIWEKLYGVDKWGLKALQSILKDLGHYHGAVDGADGPKTQAAFTAFRKSAGVFESGKEDPATRKSLFATYMKGKHDIKIDASRFCKVAGNLWMGCAANNQTKQSKEAAPENCRVAFILIVPNKNFPVHFPCQDGNEVACQAQCKKAGKRSGAGIGCMFYDELVREEKQDPVSVEKPVTQDEPAWMPIARKELGVTEIPGEKHNPRILEYHATTYQKIKNDDEDGAWCASFVNWCLIQSGYAGNNSAKAVDWTGFGREVKEPILGAVAVVKFGPGRFHVGFVEGLKGERILVLGGNQTHGTKVSVSGFTKSEIHCYRLPKEYAGHEIKAKAQDGQYGHDDYTGTR